ncbi:MAG: cysteine desulfurase family protein [Acidimicrobiales bacterium]
MNPTSSRHYLDHASSSPMRPEAVEAMVEWMGPIGAADPGRVHSEGRQARAAIEQARGQVADLVGVRPRQVIFTSGATEAANAAVWGATRARPGGVVVCPTVEHSSVRDASRRLAPVLDVTVDALGRVDPDCFIEALEGAAGGAGVALAHLQWANHEVGTIQPVADAAEACRARGIPLHVDAAGAVGHIRTDLERLGADFVSISAHKMGGPRGIGALVVGRGVRVEPLLVGGDQERARRAGMENTPAIIGFGATAEVLSRLGRIEAEATQARTHTESVLAGALACGDVAPYGDTEDRLPHIVCLGVMGVEAEAVVLGLDQAGLAVHSGSACSSETLEPSPVLAAMGVPAESSLRVSVGWSTTDNDVDAFIEAFPGVVRRLRALGANS